MDIDAGRFDIISMPEFLAEGCAIKNLTDPDRVVIGTESRAEEASFEKIKSLFTPFISEEKIIKVNESSSELSKLVSNAMLAQRVSSINSISALCEMSGAKILEVKKAVSADKRIGAFHLHPSIGFGGSCFEKDILSLVYISEANGFPEIAEYWHSVLKINEFQKSRMANTIATRLIQEFG
jgi:UDPglucose 6-dehydrogenase